MAIQFTSYSLSCMWHYFGFQPFLLPLVDHGGNMNKFVGWILLKGTINVLYTKLCISNTIMRDMIGLHTKLNLDILEFYILTSDMWYENTNS